MPVSKETAVRAEQPIDDSIIDPNPYFPSDVVAPTKSDIEPQQASTQPGSGSDVHSGVPTSAAVEVPGRHMQGRERVPFKEQVIGVAKKTRGTLLGKPELKHQGEKILEGHATVLEPTSHTN